MKYQLSLKIIICLGITLCLNSCVKDMDFPLEENSETLSIIESDLLISNLSALDFKTETTLNNRIIFSDTLSINLSKPEFLLIQLTKANLTFNFINTLDMDFKVDFEFLNAVGEVEYSVHVPIAAGTSHSPIKVETMVFIEEPEIEIFKDATKVVYKITLPPSEKPVALEAKGNVILYSKSILFFE